MILRALATAFGVDQRGDRLQLVSEGAAVEVELDRAFGGRVRATSVRVAAPHAGTLAFHLPADQVAGLLAALRDPDGRQLAYECVETTQPRPTLFWLFGPARWLPIAPGYGFTLKDRQVTARREGGDGEPLALLAGIRAAMAVAVGSDLLYEDWRLLARALEARIDDRGPWTGAAYSLSASLRGIEFVLDIGPPLHGVRISTTRRRPGSSYRVASPGAAALLGPTVGAPFTPGMERIPPGWSHRFHALGAPLIEATPSRLTLALLGGRPELERVVTAAAVLAPLLEADDADPYR